MQRPDLVAMASLISPGVLAAHSNEYCAPSFRVQTTGTAWFQFALDLQRLSANPLDRGLLGRGPRGPATYSGIYGDDTTVVKMHSGNGPHEDMDRRAIACFDQALADVGVIDDDPVRQVLHDYFEWATNTTMSKYHESADDVPDGLRIPRWSWDGLQT